MDILTLSLAVKNALAAMGVKIEPSKEILSFSSAQHVIPATVDSFVVGEKYIVHLEHGDFEAVCKLYDENGIIGKWLGNMAISDIGNNTGMFEDTGEDYCVYYLAYPGSDPVYAFFDVTPSAFCKISTPETIHPIDPKYLPGVCLPVVKLSTELTEGVSVLTAEEAVAMDNVVGNFLLVSFRFFDGNVYPVIMYKQEINGITGFMGDFRGISVAIAKADDVWLISTGLVE